MAICRKAKVLTRNTSVLCSPGKGFSFKDMPAKFVKSLVDSRLSPIIDRMFEIPELFELVNIYSLGTNQLHHVIRMAEQAVQIPEHVLAELGITKDTLITAMLFHDIGKGSEISDRRFAYETAERTMVPELLRKYGVPEWVEYIIPKHRHVVRSVQIAETYQLDREIIEAIAIHHHVKITSAVMSILAKPLALTPLICNDILQFRPSQYAVQGGFLAQVLGILDQLCAIERKLPGKVYLAVEPSKLEDEVVKDLIIGVAENDDARLKLLEFELTGDESVILLDLCYFGIYVRAHTEYEVQTIKKEILNTIRSVIRSNSQNRRMDAVGLIGGDEFVIITSVNGVPAMDKMIKRITSAIKVRTGFDCHIGCGSGERIAENFHQARIQATKHKNHTSNDYEIVIQGGCENA